MRLESQLSYMNCHTFPTGFYLSTTAGNITEEIIMGYLDRHIRKGGFSPSA